jgi:Na+/H+ antiporter NhaD/arsenite permease-like protein
LAGPGSVLRLRRSRLFPKPSTGKIALKIINHYGDEILKGGGPCELTSYIGPPERRGAIAPVRPTGTTACRDCGTAMYRTAQNRTLNIGGTATLVGDPPNIIIGSAAGLSYLDFLVHLGPIVVVLLVVFSFQARWMFRGELTFHAGRVRELLLLDEREALLPGSLLPKALAVLGLVTLAFVLQGPLGYDPSVVALLGAGVLLLIAGGDRPEYLRDVEWPTLAFFIGLFIMVGGLVKTGVIEELAEGLIELTDGRLFLATAVLLIASALLSALVDNIPYVATMVPIVGALAGAIPGDTTVLWWALALGADLGGNATSIGASANVVVLGVAERSGHRIPFVRFLRYGVPVAALSIAISLAYLWLRYFAFA